MLSPGSYSFGITPQSFPGRRYSYYEGGSGSRIGVRLVRCGPRSPCATVTVGHGGKQQVAGHGSCWTRLVLLRGLEDPGLLAGVQPQNLGPLNTFRLVQKS